MLYDGTDGGGNRSDPYRTGVVDTIVSEVQSEAGEDRCVLLLGYRDKMETMFRNVNPGLSRRYLFRVTLHSGPTYSMIGLRLKTRSSSMTSPGQSSTISWKAR